ncbi:MetQ/NlpA family ABC transporter substrate-binding protein [Calorimonas adulescens]|uniref:Lipoprotein n=1 Tax=Calorimonas adulescens TaxID=2606906 RepID=A0A5D8QAK4_9THEO|nr:MetQ/NlpA family ABC transporter substrate-binding protein [Calorimonas adulescens]
MKKLIVLLVSVLLVLSLAACGSTTQSSSAQGTHDGDVTKIKVGVTAGPHEEVLEQVKEILKDEGIDVEIVTFTDYVQPNIQLSEGALDANSFQHQPFFDDFVKERNITNLTTIGKTMIFPMGIYSNKIKDMKDLPENGTVSVPNDATNEGRALLLLQSAGVIKLKDDAGLTATPLDIVENPKNIKIVEIDAAQTVRSLEDVDAAAINTNYAVEMGFNPVKDSIFIEGPNSPYANVIAVRKEDADKEVFKKLLEAYHDPRIKEFVDKKYQGSVVMVEE